MSLSGKLIREMTKNTFRNLGQTGEIFEFLASVYNYTEEEIIGRVRTKHLMLARRHAIVLLTEAGFSRSYIGRIMNDRGHSAIIKALQAVDEDERLEMETSFQEWKRELKDMGYMLLELSFPDGDSFTGYARMGTLGQKLESSKEINDKYDCTVRILKTGLSLAGARKAQEAAIMKKQHTGGP